MNTYELIKKKRDGESLSTEEIGYLINGYTNGHIPDYQMAAFLMSVYFKGMNDRECRDMTMKMVNSGASVDLSPIKGFKVDKHSTGGVGDKTTLVLAPLVASCGGIVAKMSGRELGHTGGTIDKLESIPGMRTAFTRDQFIDITNRVHVCVIAQTETLVPADKLIYALRNITATVDVIPLIASSIMSKKLAAGADGIVLDVKTGAGAFTPLYTDAVKLAKTMVAIGEGAGKKTTAFITGMAQPLGYAIGNALEVKESIDMLNGSGPADLTDLVLTLGSEMLLLSGIGQSQSEAKAMLKSHLADKKGAQKLKAFIGAQGGDPAVVENTDLLHRSKTTIPLESDSSGFVQGIDALEIGMAAKILGAGRQTKEDVIDLSIGIVLNKKVGDPIQRGESLAVLHSDGDNAKIHPAAKRLMGAYTIGPDTIAPPKLILAKVSKDTVQELNP
ncbi:MAG: pyrimidine-nucleoside phosphorylase [Syntrophobacterales bacterium]|nr:MAG: pyrimidine-nucleoside phosphorylase [Syntrophobacterales bacterium]